jgi:hypothetical protein
MCGGGDDNSIPAPQAPDPAATAAAQYRYNSQAARDAAYLNSIDQYGPYGSTTFARRPDGTPFAQAVTLAPEVQAMLDAQFGAGTALNAAAQKQLGYLPQDKFELPNSPNARGYAEDAYGDKALDFNNFADPLAGGLYQSQRQDLGPTASTQDIANTSYEQAKSLFQPDIDAARKQMEITLGQRGIPVGSEIWKDEMGRLDRQANNAYAGASRQAILDSGAEQSRQFGVNLGTAQYGAGEDSRMAGADLSNRQFLGAQQGQQFNQLGAALGYGNNAYQQNLSNQLLERNQPFAEAAALMGTTPQFQSPAFMNTAATQVAPPDYTGVVNNNYSTQMGGYSAQQNRNAGQNSGMFGAIGQIGAAAAPVIFSDEEMKEDRHPADGEAILAMFRDMPVDDYAYKGEARAAFDLPERRTGTMAQDYADHFGGDGRTIDLGDAVGKLMAAMKSLDRRTAGLRRTA